MVREVIAHTPRRNYYMNDSLRLILCNGRVLITPILNLCNDIGRIMVNRTGISPDVSLDGGNRA